MVVLRRTSNRASGWKHTVGSTVVRLAVHPFYLQCTVVRHCKTAARPPQLPLVHHFDWNSTPRVTLSRKSGADTWKARNTAHTLIIGYKFTNLPLSLSIGSIRWRYKRTKLAGKTVKIEVYQLPLLVPCLSPSKVINLRMVGRDSPQNTILLSQPCVWLNMHSWEHGCTSSHFLRF